MMNSTFHSALDLQDKTIAGDIQPRPQSVFDDNFFMEDSVLFSS